MPNDESVVVPA